MRTSILSPALLEVLGLMSEGMTNKEIAFFRKTALKTVNTQVANILIKTDSRNRTEAVSYYWNKCKK